MTRLLFCFNNINKMSTNRKLVFANDQIYHIFNRGVEKRPTFTNKKEFTRACETIKYYRFANLTLRFSKFLLLNNEEKEKFMIKLDPKNTLIEIIAYCFMPNHFHFLIKQNKDNGISKFMANFQNSYSKYFNTRNERIGPLFQGLFKAVLVEDDDQLLHLTRYIHLNPVTSYLINEKTLPNYQWSSFPEYLSQKEGGFIPTNIVLDFFKSSEQYNQFVLDQVQYARTLDSIKHVLLE